MKPCSCQDAGAPSLAKLLQALGASDRIGQPLGPGIDLMMTFTGAAEPQRGISNVSREDITVDYRQLPMPHAPFDKLCVDLESIVHAARSKPVEFEQLLQHLWSGNLKAAQSLLKSLGLTETDLQARGGGFFWLIVGAAVIVFCATTFTGHDAEGNLEAAKPAPPAPAASSIVIDADKAKDLEKIAPGIFGRSK